MHNTLTIFFTLLIALILSLLPMPEWAVWFRPSWVLMVLIYWSMMAPHRVGIGVAWLLGIIVDLLNGTMLGEHAFAFTIVIYFISRLHIRLRMSPMLQQGVSVLFFILTYQFIIYCLQGFIGELPGSHLYWLSAITSVLLWPWLFLILRDYRKRYQVA